MIWLNPAAWIALVAIAAPLLIHIFVQRKAEPLPFPTLRFLLPTRLAALRRRMLDDVPLLAVRASILAAAVAALAGPLLVTAARRQLWNTRVVRASVVDERVARAFQARDRGAESPALRVFQTQTFETRSLADGIRHARAWLDTAPPARRELLVVSPLAIGSLTAADVASIPAEIGLRFERSGELPESRTVDGGDVLGLQASGRVPHPEATRYRQRVTLTADGTVVDDGSADPAAFPVDVVAPPSARAAVDRAISAVLARRVWAPPDDRRATLVLAVPGVGPAEAGPLEERAEAVRQPWMADTIARIGLDSDLLAMAARTSAGLGLSRFSAAPWVAAVYAADGSPLAAAAADAGRLLIVAAADSSSFLTPLLLRSIVNSMADPPDLRAAEVLPIPDEQLRAWTRPPGPLGRFRTDALESDDRRWLWALALVLIGVETWLRRERRTSNVEPRTRTSNREPRTSNPESEAPRVA